MSSLKLKLGLLAAGLMLSGCMQGAHYEATNAQAFKPKDKELLAKIRYTNVPVAERIFGGEKDYLRPQFIQPYKCKNVLIEGVRIVDTPMWEQVDALFARYENRPLGEKKRIVGEEVPLGRMGVPDDLTGAALFLASADSDYITAQTINVDGGNWMS